MKEVWLTTSDCASLLQCSDRHVRGQKQLYDYRYKEDGSLEINLKTLPISAQDQYILAHLPQFESINTAIEDIDTLCRALERSTDRTKKHFDKWNIILQKTADINSRKELDRWVLWWNKEYPSLKTSVQSIYRQRAIVEEAGKMALVSTSEVFKSTVNDTYFDDFKKAYLTQNKISAPYSRMIALGKAKERGEITDNDNFPSLSAFMRRLRREVSPDVIYFAREGRKKYFDNKSYHIDRVYDDVSAGQVWIGDTKNFDVFIKMDGEEKPMSAYLTMFIDAATYMPMGYHVHYNAPSTENTLRALKNGIARYGKPSELYVDNGREYRNKDFSGQSRGNKIIYDEQYAQAVVSRLDIKMHFAIVKNSRAKTIERQFEIVKNGFDRLFNSFKGGTVVEKPEQIKRILKKGDYVSWDDFKAQADKYLEQVFPGMPCAGKMHKGKSRAELWNMLIQQREPMYRVTEDTLAMLVTRTCKNRIVHRGFRIPELDTWYWAEWMPLHKGREITLRYDVEDMRIAWAYDESGKLINTCELTESVGAMVKNDDVVAKAQIQEGVARKRHEEKILKELYPDMPKDAAKDFLHSLSVAVGNQDIDIPQGITALTRHDDDASFLAEEAKIGDPNIINMLPKPKETHKKKLTSLYDDDDEDFAAHG